MFIFDGSPYQSINQSIFILQNNPLGFSNRRRLDRATDQSNFTLCLSQYKTDSSIPIGSPSSMSALLRIYSVTAETGERPGGHLAITQTTCYASEKLLRCQAAFREREEKLYQYHTRYTCPYRLTLFFNINFQSSHLEIFKGKERRQVKPWKPTAAALGS